MSVDTYFAPPQRTRAEQLDRQQTKLSEERTLQEVLRVVPEFVVVLNAERQIVYANQALVQFLGSGGQAPLCGRRPGELFHCIHATEMEYGCGTALSCRSCGAAQAILETQRTNASVSGECTIVTRERDRELTRNFRINTTPFLVQGEAFVLCSLTDIGEQKRKLALERIFFHDILNTASSLKVYIDLIKRGTTEAPPQFLNVLESIANSLVEEIQSQRMLVSAENGTLEVQRNLISSKGLVERVAGLFRHDELAEGRQLEVAPFSEAISFVGDEAILRRVLVNAVKNALEAAAPGAAITLGSRYRDNAVEFSVHNPGSIDEDIQEHIFKRYYSTKGTDRGLGTYSMKLLTESYLKGDVFFRSTPQEGTTFRIVVPKEPASGPRRSRSD